MDVGHHRRHLHPHPDVHGVAHQRDPQPPRLPCEPRRALPARGQDHHRALVDVVRRGHPPVTRQRPCRRSPSSLGRHRRSSGPAPPWCRSTMSTLSFELRPHGGQHLGRPLGPQVAHRRADQPETLARRQISPAVELLRIVPVESSGAPNSRYTRSTSAISARNAAADPRTRPASRPPPDSA